jgi:CAAX amino terminal protease family.
MAENATRPPVEPTRRVQALEVGVFLFLFVPSLVVEYFSMGTDVLSFKVVAVMSILRNLSLMCLVFYFLWRNGEAFRQIGLTRSKAAIEVLWGLALFFPITFAINVLDDVLGRIGIGRSTPPEQPSLFAFTGAGDLFLALALVITVAVVEEILFRGYLIRRFSAISGNVPLAILVAAAIFSLGHHYEGGAGVLSAGIFGVFMGVVYTWRKSLVAPIVIHFIQDFVAIILLPLLASQ